MFRIESYITSIILSYVDRYIKNFRQQDAQVSLWEGDGSFQNLNLDLDVLEEELNLPFSFVSGHIHELLIHVPWTRLTSEAVKVTINTIECVMKLKPVGTQEPQAKPIRKTPRAVEDPQNQSLMSGLVNKIICNLSVTCNNLILKYVEEDIVLSMNIKTLSFSTVNLNWETAFIELSPSQLELRKLISLSDVTVCLDKRNASGRIESYLEPLLYRCFLTARLWQSYPSATAKRASLTRLDVFCEHMTFTVSEPQLPMLMRLMELCLALHRKQLSQTSLVPSADDPAQEKSDDDASVGQPVSTESWSGWALSWMPTLMPVVDGNDGTYDYYQDSPSNNIINIGFYIDTFTLALKLCEPDGSGGVKTQSQAFMHILLRGCRMELLSHNTDWTNVQMGISQASIKPDGDCCCGISELAQLVYLSSGSMQEEFLSGSLFGKQSCNLQDRIGHSWKYHLELFSETIMLERTPALAVDYLSCINKDKSEDDEDSDDEDNDSLPKKEKVMIRYVAGPVVIRVCSGLIHRIQMLMKACSTFDYIPYTANITLPVTQDNQVLDLVHRLSEKSIAMDDELYSRYLPIHTSQFTAFNTTIEFYPANHLPVSLSSLGRKVSRSQRRAQGGVVAPSGPPPCVTVEWKCVFATLTRPLYPEKILLMASKFQREKLPLEITNTSLTRLAFKAVGVCSSVRLPFVQAMKVVEMSSVSGDQTWHSLLTPLQDQISSDIGLHVETVTFTSSKAKLILLNEIMCSLVATNNRQRYLAAHKIIYNTTLLHDAANTTDIVYLKLTVEHLKGRRVLTGMSQSTCLSVSSCQVFALRLADRGEEWEAMIVSAPDTNSPSELPLLDAVYQQPGGLNKYPPLLSFRLGEVRFSADPLLYSWLLYVPTSTLSHHPSLLSHKSTEQLTGRKVSESSLSSYVRRAPTPNPQESAHSSSERETAPSSQPLVEHLQAVSALTFADRVASWYPVWKAMVVHGDVNQLVLYFPSTSLASPTPLSMEEGLKAALNQHKPPLQVAVVKLPSVTLRCGNYKQGVQQYLSKMPVILPATLWTPDKDNFPWLLRISELHCFTLHGSSRLPLLKPLSFNCTIGTSPRFVDNQTLMSLAVCVHLDTTPVNIKISEEQVVLIVSLLMTHMRVASVLALSSEPTATSDSPAIKLSSDESSNRSQSDDVTRLGGPVRVKLTGLLQWTLARTTLSMYSKPSPFPLSVPSSPSTPHEIKLALDVEDIILSLDVERVYHKVKLKVATASVCHYVKSSKAGQWKRGAFEGQVMRGYDLDGFTIKHSLDDSQAPAGFLTTTVTRALATNFHSRLGSGSPVKKMLKCDKFITEIEVKMQPLDFVLSPTTVGVFVHVLQPLLSLSPPTTGAPQAGAPTAGKSISSGWHVGSLPLLYLELMMIRVALPITREHLGNNHPDVMMIQFDGMTANPHPENPICRNPLRPDIYLKGEKQRMLNIPGAELEDRQYQFNMSNLTIQTGLWSELKDLLVHEVSPSSQQNPALDWNEGRSPAVLGGRNQLMSALVSPFNLAVVVAPAMFYLDKDIVCGHAAEVNAVSDIMISVTLDQLFLSGSLASEMLGVLRSASSQAKEPRGLSLALPPSATLPYRRHPHLETLHDSGIESTDSVASLHVRQVDPNLPAVHAVSSSGISQISGLIHSSLPSTIYPTSLVWPSKRSIIPWEVLVTGSSITFSMFAVAYEEQLIYEPLLYTNISQPHAFSRKNTDNVTTCQVSAFDMSMSIGIEGHMAAKQVTMKPFPQPIVETRSGDPNPLTGIPPAFLTLKLAWTKDKPPKINLDIGRPVKFICKLEIIEYLKKIQTLVSLNFFIPLNRGLYGSRSKEQEQVTFNHSSLQAQSEHHLRKVLRRFGKLSIVSQQIVVAVSSCPQNGAELCLSLGGCNGHLISNHSLQQAATGFLALDSITISTHKVTSARTRLFLAPWQLTVHTSLSWDSWLSVSDPPLLTISAESDVLSLQVSPEQLLCLAAVCQDYAALFGTADSAAKKPHLSRQNSTGGSSTEEQQYHDDLQAGAFQFVDGSSGREDLPLTYQVVFWAGQGLPPSMAWRYPQPRAIAKFCLLPVPFRDTPEQSEEPNCVLQYYSESQACYQDLLSFRLSETDSQLIELPMGVPRVVATAWRVLLSPVAARVASVKALAACVRVDSFFSPTLVPSVQLAVSFNAVQVTLWTYTDSYLPLPSPLDRYYLDRRFPEEHDFMSIVLEQSNFAFSLWSKVSHQVTVRGRARADVLNYHTLGWQCVVPPVPLVASSHTASDCRQVSLVTGHIQVRLGAVLTHSLAASATVWGQCLNSPVTQPSVQPVLTPYVICNNSCLSFRFRQTGSDEYIPLQCFQSHLYSWRTTKCPMGLQFGLLEPEDNEWSEGLNLRPESNSVVKLISGARELALIVSVKRLTPTVCQVTINGQLALHNNLSGRLEVRIIPEGGERQSSLVVTSGSSPPSVVLDPRHSVSLKLRHSAASLWSGEIPLRFLGKPSMQWEVKLPLKDKGQFQSIWCHVVWNTLESIDQILVVFSPLYTIKSLLPCPANVVVETPALSSSLTLPISGRGAVQNLDSPGLSCEMHNLTFQLDGKVPVSSPPVSLHYQLMDGSPTPFAPKPPEDMSCLPPSAPDQWPYLGPDWAGVEWMATTQPDTVTHVKVRFSDDSVAINTLLVEVQPWALLVNTLGSTIYLQGRERTLCSLAHRAVISPPPLESTFQIGVELESSVQLTDPIQLKRGPGFEMPHIPGLLAPCGSLNTTIIFNDTVCFLNLTSSLVSGSLRLMHVRSAYVVASLSSRDLTVSALAVKQSATPLSLPEGALGLKTPLPAQAKPSKVKCHPVAQWRVIGASDLGLIPYLVVGAGDVTSRPVQIPNSTERYSTTIVFPSASDLAQAALVMTTEQVDGQTHILFWDQPCPQITLHNNTNSTILFAKANVDDGGYIEECEHISWQLRVLSGSSAHYSFPETVNSPDPSAPLTLPPAVIAVISPLSYDLKWSEPISLTQCSGRLLTLLGLPDLSLSVSQRGFTTHVTLTQASHTEILAVDIRGQLSRQLMNERRMSEMSHRSEEKHETAEELVEPPSLPPSEAGIGENWGLDVSCFVDSLTATLLSQSDQGCECHEVAALSLDHIAVTLHPYPHQDSCVREMKVHATVGDMQLDNQEFSVGAYDFPVVLVMQKPPEPKTAVAMTQPARKLVDKARTKGSAMDLTIVMDINSHNTVAIQDISIKQTPMQIYIEDKYILHLKECLLNTLPSSLLNETPSKPVTSKTVPSPFENDVDSTKNFKTVEKIADEKLDESQKKDLSEGEEEDLFNVSEPDAENQLLEEAPSEINVFSVKEAPPSFEPESVWTVRTSPVQISETTEPHTESEGFPIPADVLSASRDVARPLRLRSLSISELDLLVSIHTSTRFYIALDHSPLQLAAFKRSSLFTTAYRLGHSLTLHYFFGAIYGTGWALGSLELLGAPGGLARSLGLGLRDFISLPLQGMLVGPRAFFTGIAHGSASLMQHFAAGTITSVTRLASSWARTLDRLTLDQRDLERSEQLRRLRPQSLTQGVAQGLTGFGISLIGAISSIAHHPLQYVMSSEPDRSLVNSIGLGLVGVITRPLSGVAELVALTGEGLLSGVGWTNVPRIRHEPVVEHSQCGTDSRLKFQWKLLMPGELLLLTAEATSDCYEAVTLLVTNSSLYVVNSELDIVVRAVKLMELKPVEGYEDPTLVAFKIQPAKEQAQLLSQTRIQEFVRESQRMLMGELAHVSPPNTPIPEPDEPHLQFFVNPQSRSNFLSVLAFATKHATGRGFPVFS